MAGRGQRRENAVLEGGGSGGRRKRKAYCDCGICPPGGAVRRIPAPTPAFVILTAKIIILHLPGSRLSTRHLHELSAEFQPGQRFFPTKRIKSVWLSESGCFGVDTFVLDMVATLVSYYLLMFFSAKKERFITTFESPVQLSSRCFM